MDVIKELENFNKEIQIAQSVVQELNGRRIDWCRTNKREIKKLYPIKNKIYQIVDIKNAFRHSFRDKYLKDDCYFF